MTEEFTIFKDVERTIEQKKVPHPWLRYFARSLDLSLYSVILLAITLLVLRWSPQNEFLSNMLNTYIACGLMLLIEPILLSTFGTTFGKWVFGLVLRDMDGAKLKYKQAIRRTLGMFGMGYNIPVYNIVRSIKSYGECKEGKMLSWDEDIHYTLKDKKIIRPLGFIVISTAIFLLVFLVSGQGQMPKHRGNITAEQYFENCNDIMEYNHIDFGRHLNEQGKWVDKGINEHFVINIFLQQLPEHILTITDGRVTGVKLEVETTTAKLIGGYKTHLYIAVLSFVAAQDEMNCIRLQRSNIFEKLGNGLENRSFSEAGIKITNKVEYRGYEDAERYLIPIVGKEQYFHMIFTMEKE